jgi:DNA-binding MarR family transcriptional regulator/GNAT superfamily N-acetyltransferase
MEREAIDRVRAFNRTVTERIGGLEETYLGRGRPLGETRLLWEVGPEGADVRRLRSRLGLDAGYASRMLRSLERDGLITVEPAPHDRRVRRARLTARGLREHAQLDRRSDELVGAMLEPLDERQRGRLLAAVDEAERLLRASMVDIRPADPAERDARWCIARYVEELGARFDAGFDPARSLPAADADLRAPAGVLLLARLRGDPVGCGAVKLHGEEPAELKRMWVSPDARGLGLGRRLLRELEAFAAANGARTVRLETNRTLVEAIALYRTSGYREVPAFNDERYAHHWFEKQLAAHPSHRRRNR